MTKPVIAIDVDDVLAVETEAVRQFANERYGHKHTTEDYRVPGRYWSYWDDVQGVDKEEGRRRYGEYIASGLKARLAVMDGAIEAIQYLAVRYDLVVVTSRDAHLVDITREWLQQHFPDIFKDVAFVAVWTGDVKGSKAAICQDLQAKYLIDDNPDHLVAASEVGIRGVLFGEYGWSAGIVTTSSIVRCKNWKEVQEYFERQSI